MVYVSGGSKWGTVIIGPYTSLTTTNIPMSGAPSVSTITDTTSYRMKSYRSGRSSNPVRYITAARVPWRNPSSYTRTALSYVYRKSRVSYTDINNVVRKIVEGESPRPADSSVHGPFLTASLEATAPSNTINRLNTELLLKVKDMKVNLGEALAESKSTISHLSKTSSTVVRALLSARRGRWSDVAKHLGVKPKSVVSGGAFAERWLEYQFGWMPLLSDIHGSFELFQHGLRTRGMILSAFKQGVDRDDVSLKLSNWEISRKSESTTRIKIYYRVKDSELSALTELGLADPLQVAWALVPYSFVVDWFLPIGNVLEAVGATRGLEFIGGYRSIKSSGESRSLYFPSTPSGLTADGDPFECQVAFEAYKRFNLATFPQPSLYLKSPWSTSHLISAASLIRQLIR